MHFLARPPLCTVERKCQIALLLKPLDVLFEELTTPVERNATVPENFPVETIPVASSFVNAAMNRELIRFHDRTLRLSTAQD